MEQVLLVVGVIVVAWFVVATIVALGMGRAVRLADDRHRAQTSYRRASAPRAVPRSATRVPARAS